MAAAPESRWGEKLLKEILVTAVRTDILDEKDLQSVVVDTTVQEKAIAFPTDSPLYHKARGALKRRFKRRMPSSW